MKFKVLMFLVKYRRTFMALGLLMALATFALPMTACGVPVWLTDASSIIALVGASFTSIASFIAGLTGNVALAALLATVTTWITEVQTGLSDLELLITQYQESPTPTLLTNIESGLSDVMTNVKQDFSNLGLPATVLTVITGIAALALNLLTEWQVAITGVTKAATADEFKSASAKLADLAQNLPAAKTTFAAAVNNILNTPTGDATIDAALAKATRL